MVMRNNKKVWEPVTAELVNWTSAGQTVKLWLRDDDGVEPTQALDTFAARANHYGVRFTLAVIPQFVISELADWAKNQPHCTIGVHGISHQNHASKNEKKSELGLHQPLEKIMAELTKGHEKIAHMFGDKYIKMLVPPWNRIDAAIIEQLPNAGFTCLSTFAMAHQNIRVDGLSVINTQIDIIDWKGNRRGKQVSVLAKELGVALVSARQNNFAPVGILTHHLVHDTLAHKFLDELFPYMAEQTCVSWLSARQLM